MRVRNAPPRMVREQNLLDMGSEVPLVAIVRRPLTIDPLSLQFVIWAQAMDAIALDIGCGDGVVTTTLLARGGHVVAVDPSAASLHCLVEQIPVEQCQRLKVQLGQLPDLDFKLASFGAIHAAHVLHLLDPVGLGQSLRKFYRWLYPEGKLFVSAPTPAVLRNASNVSPLRPDRLASLCPLDEGRLCRELTAAGFVIEERTTYVSPWRHRQECCAVIARRSG
jgi:SAM-dependent methyltransferase